MGHKISDGKAFDAAAPSGQIINDYDLYRIGKLNGFAIGSKDASQTDRTLSFDMDTNVVVRILLPAITPAVGDLLYWATPGSFQRGDTHLQATAATTGDPPACKVVEVKNANGYAAVRVLND